MGEGKAGGAACGLGGPRSRFSARSLPGGSRSSPSSACSRPRPAATRPSRVARFAASSHARERERDWPAALEQLADGLEAGLAFPAAAAFVANSGPSALRGPFAGFYQAAREGRLEQRTRRARGGARAGRRDTQPRFPPARLLRRGADRTGGADAARARRRPARALRAHASGHAAGRFRSTGRRRSWRSPRSPSCS